MIASSWHNATEVYGTQLKRSGPGWHFPEQHLAAI
jgi:hypothetical protein